MPTALSSLSRTLFQLKAAPNILNQSNRHTVPNPISPIGPIGPIGPISPMFFASAQHSALESINCPLQTANCFFAFAQHCYVKTQAKRGTFLKENISSPSFPL